MKQKISFFDFGLCGNLLRRFWPLWSCYFAVLMLTVPIPLLNDVRFNEWLNYDVLSSAKTWLLGSAVVGALAALCMFSFLYSARSTGMIASLPLRRECVYTTAYITGLAPLLLADILVMLISAAFLLPTGKLDFPFLLQWLGIVLMGNTMFYSFACFCAMLTGSIIIMPLVYAVLNLAVYVAETAIRRVLHLFVYGLGSRGRLFDLLSPIVYISRSIGPYYVENWENAREVYFGGWIPLIVYTAVAILFAGGGFLLYRRRNMESATDVVAVPVLKPVFKYCMTFGCAVVLPCLVSEMFTRITLYGLSLTLFLLVLALLGAFIGYFSSEMLMAKTVRVFSGKWRNYAVSCVIIIVLMLSCEFDLFGYERYIPDPGEVEKAYLHYVQCELSEPQNIEAIMDLHETILNNKAENEASVTNRTSMTLSYTLTNGRTVERRYFVRDYPIYDAPDSELRQAETIANSLEAVVKRSLIREFAPDEILYFSICSLVSDGKDIWNEEAVDLTHAEAHRLYTEAMRPDILDGTLGRIWLIQDEAYARSTSNLTIELNLNRDSLTYEGFPTSDEYQYLIVPMDARRTLAWLAENTDIDITTRAEVEAALPNHYPVTEILTTTQ